MDKAKQSLSILQVKKKKLTKKGGGEFTQYTMD
jgi:hypothetical protein